MKEGIVAGMEEDGAEDEKSPCKQTELGGADTSCDPVTREAWLDSKPAPRLT